MKTQTKTTFFILVGLAALISLFIFLARDSLRGIGATPVDIQVAVAPALAGWVREAALDFNDSNQRGITVQVTPLNWLNADDGRKLNALNAPEVWIAEADFVHQMSRLSLYEGSQSVAQDRLVWVAVAARTLSDVVG